MNDNELTQRNRGILKEAAEIAGVEIDPEFFEVAASDKWHKYCHHFRFHGRYIKVGKDSGSPIDAYPVKDGQRSHRFFVLAIAAELWQIASQENSGLEWWNGYEIKQEDKLVWIKDCPPIKRRDVVAVGYVDGRIRLVQSKTKDEWMTEECQWSKLRSEYISGGTRHFCSRKIISQELDAQSAENNFGLKGLVEWKEPPEKFTDFFRYGGSYVKAYINEAYGWDHLPIQHISVNICREAWGKLENSSALMEKTNDDVDQQLRAVNVDLEDYKSWHDPSDNSWVLHWLKEDDGYIASTLLYIKDSEDGPVAVVQNLIKRNELEWADIELIETNAKLSNEYMHKINYEDVISYAAHVRPEWKET